MVIDLEKTPFKVNQKLHASADRMKAMGTWRLALGQGRVYMQDKPQGNHFELYAPIADTFTNTGKKK